MDEIKLDWLSQTDKCLRMKLFFVCFSKTKHCIQTVFCATQVFRQTHEWLQWTFLLFCPDRKRFHLCPKHPRTNKASWAPDPYEQISSSHTTCHFRLFYQWFTKHTILPCRLEKFVLGWQDRQQNAVDFRRRLQGLSKNWGGLSRPGQAGEIRVLSTGASHTHAFRWCLLKKTHDFLFRSLKGVVQRGNLEHEGLLGGGVLRLGGNWSHIWRSREEGECWAQWPWRKRGVLGSLLVRNAVRDLVQWYQERHKQCPFLLCDWSLPWPACRDYQLLCRDGGGSRTRRSTVVQSGDINGSKDSPWFLDWDSVFLHHTQETWMKCLKSYTFNCLIIIYLEMMVIKWFTAVLLSLLWNMFFEK